MKLPKPLQDGISDDFRERQISKNLLRELNFHLLECTICLPIFDIAE